MKILIKNGHVLDPLTGVDEQRDVLIRDGKIERVARQIPEENIDKTINANGAYVMPGIIDLHVHMREPGFEYKETITTAGKAAARGGVTTMCAMPNTKPVIDTKEKVEMVHRKASKESLVNVIQLGAVTMGQEGKELADIAGMAEADCHAISEDGKSVMNVELYKKAMKIAAKYQVSIFAHCEDASLVQGGVMNDSNRAEELGMKGISNESEDVVVERDIKLAKETGVKLHLCHCSTKDSVKMLEQAKNLGLSVTGEVCPHHFTLSTADITENDGNYKMNPPLREVEDVVALRQGLRDNILDVIATDHAPHSEEDKEGGIEKAAFGIVGLETLLSLTYTELVKKQVLTPLQMVEKLSMNPAKILGLNDRGSIVEGKIADIVVFNQDQEYFIDKNDFVSKGKNTPFNGRKVCGEVRYTIVAGNIVYEAK